MHLASIHLHNKPPMGERIVIVLFPLSVVIIFLPNLKFLA